MIDEVGAIDRKNYWIPRPEQCKCPAAVRMHNKLHPCPIFKINKWGVISPTHRLARARGEATVGGSGKKKTRPYRILLYENHEPWQAEELTRETNWCLRLRITSPAAPMSQEYHRNESRFHEDRLKNPIKKNLRRIDGQRFFKFAFDAQLLPTPYRERHRERETHTQSGFAAQRVGGPTRAHPARPGPRGQLAVPVHLGWWNAWRRG